MLAKLALEEFCDRLADGRPTPGGGSAAAVAGAMGCGLVAMFCKLTANRKQYSAVREEMSTAAAYADQWRGQLLQLAELDSKAFEKVLAAIRMTRDTEAKKAARRQAIDEATLEATGVPMQTAAACVAVMERVPSLAGRGNPNALSDLKVGLELLWTGFQGALANVEINLPALAEKEATTLQEETLKLAARAQKNLETGRQAIAASIQA